MVAQHAQLLVNIVLSVAVLAVVLAAVLVVLLDPSALVVFTPQ
jgi:hypothetical protein